MYGKGISCYSFLFIFIQLIRITHLTFHDSGHGFITKKSRYFNDELSHIHEGIDSLRYLQTVDYDALANINLRFDPEILDFRERSLGAPHSRTVTLYNTDKNKSIDLTSIVGNTVHFHSSFFEDKQIPPNGNTSFKVVYLGRQEGPIESTLFLHTSSGFVKYNVKAFGTYNSYRVRPIVGVKLPVNSTFTPVIYMHNPHSEPIQIVEIYSSGGGFHLELPSGQHEGPNDLWEINPHETKAVIRVRFEAQIPHNYTAYIRIKLHNPEEILIVPLEVEVTQVQNIFHPQGHVDFGVGGSKDEPREISLCLFNPLKRAVRVHSVSTLSKSIKTQYYNIRINPGTEEENKCVNVGTLTVDWKNAWQTQDYHGKIIVKFRSGKNRTEIPYFLTVLKGGLGYDKMSTTYFLNEKEMDTKERKFEVINEFFEPIKVLDVKFPFDLDTTFKVQTYIPMTIKPFEKKTLFNILLKGSTRKTDMQLTSHIKVVTNVSEINVPLLSYNGKLQLHLPFASDDRTLDIGLVGHHKKIQIFFILSNPNPVELPLVHVGAAVPMGELEITGCGSGDHKPVLVYSSFENLTKCDSIDPQGYAVIRVTIRTGENDGQIKGNVRIETPFENLSLPVFFKVAAGEIIIDRDDLIFDNCFPAKTCTHPLRVFSSFSEKMSVENILTLPPDRRVSAAITGTIIPKVNRIIGHMYFNSDLDCSPECYTGFVSEGSASWLRTLIVTKQVSEYDMKLVNTFYNRFLNFTQNGSSRALASICMRLDTTEVKGQSFASKINYTWPSLIRENMLANSTLEFPLTQVRNVSSKLLTLHNPANHNVVVQLLFENDYPHAEMLYDGLPPNFIPPSEIKYTSTNWFSFDDKVVEVQHKYFWDNLRLNVHKQSLPFILLPGQTKRVHLEFSAEDARPYSSLLLIRNNLTILEVVRLNGKGTIPRFEFAALQPGDQKPLQFDLTEKQLRSCNPELNQNPYLPLLTVRESFMAKNLGEIPVQVTSFSINGYPCEGFGFRVLDCEPFTLAPNSSRKIDLAFTPDLTLQEISRVLIIGTSLNTFVNYSLRATVSRSYCRHCTLLLDRPIWELYMGYMANLFLTVMLVLVVAIATLDANTINTRAMEVYMASNSPPLLPVLDLRKIGRQVREEIQSSSKEKVKMDQPDYTKPFEDAVKSEPAIVPATGSKAKRRLSQKNSLAAADRENSVDDDLEKERVRERQKKKDILFERHRLKSRERKSEKELKLLEDKGKKEKHAQQLQQKEAADLKKAASGGDGKKQCKTMQVPVQEEEASSTTTESSTSSSTNCDEVDKENQRLDWPKQKVHVSSQTVSDAAAVGAKEAQDVNKIKHVSFVNSKLRKKGGGKAAALGGPPPLEQDREQDHHQSLLAGVRGAATGDKSDETKAPFGHTNSNREKRRRDPKYKERKEKMIYRHKNHIERKQQISESDSIGEKEVSKNPSSFYIPLPTNTASCNIWCENKARFSDVVARNDPPNDPSPVSSQSSESPQAYTDEDCCFGGPNSSPFKQCKASCKPTMYVEPYKPIDLGPIGSKRMGTPDSNSPDLFAQDAAHYHQHHQNHLLALPTPTVPTSDFHPMNDKSVIAAVANSSTFLSSPSSASGASGATSSFFAPSASAPSGLVADDMGAPLLPQMDVWPRQQVFRDITGGREEAAGMRGGGLFAGSEIEADSWRNIPAHPSTSSHQSPSPNTDYWSNTFSSVLNSTSKLANNASYLWGSSPIWKPWSPADSPNPVRRTPPGFDDHIQKKKAEEEQKRRHQQTNSDPYNQFGGTGGSPWTQQPSSHPWE